MLAAEGAQAPGVFAGGANVIAVLILLAEFGMFRQALLRDQVRLYVGQSGLVAVLAVLVGAVRGLPELYVLAAVTVALKVVAIPLVLRRLLRDTGPADGPRPVTTSPAAAASRLPARS